MPDQPVVRVGQVWEQRSGDLKGRRLKVLNVSAGQIPYVHVELVRNTTDVQAALDGNPKSEWKRYGYRPIDLRGRKTHMQAKTLKPPRFVLVQDAPTEATS